MFLTVASMVFAWCRQSLLLRETFEREYPDDLAKAHAEYLQYPSKRLFGPLGMRRLDPLIVFGVFVALSVSSCHLASDGMLFHDYTFILLLLIIVVLLLLVVVVVLYILIIVVVVVRIGSSMIIIIIIIVNVIIL